MVVGALVVLLVVVVVKSVLYGRETMAGSCCSWCVCVGWCVYVWVGVCVCVGLCVCVGGVHVGVLGHAMLLAATPHSLSLPPSAT